MTVQRIAVTMLLFVAAVFLGGLSMIGTGRLIFRRAWAPSGWLAVAFTMLVAIALLTAGFAVFQDFR